MISQHVQPRYVLVMVLALAGVVLAILSLTNREPILIPVSVVVNSVSMLILTSLMPAHRLRTVTRVLMASGIALALMSLVSMVTS